MPLLRRRRPALPDDVRTRLGLAKGDAVLAVGRTTGDGWVVATRGELLVLEADDLLHRAWTDVDGARLDPSSNELTVTWVDGTPTTTLPLAPEAARDLARAVHDRVQSSVVHGEKVELGRGRTVRVVLRRTADGTLITQVIGAGDVDLTDPATAAAVDAAEARVREAAGLA
jgi:bifunctional DNA-binding transcriptional regulator/antitoxin component of YhaV-PrlF toxin-antitoxin module